MHTRSIHFEFGDQVTPGQPMSISEARGIYSRIAPQPMPDDCMRCNNFFQIGASTFTYALCAGWDSTRRFVTFFGACYPMYMNRHREPATQPQTAALQVAMSLPPTAYRLGLSTVNLPPPPPVQDYQQQGQELQTYVHIVQELELQVQQAELNAQAAANHAAAEQGELAAVTRWYTQEDEAFAAALHETEADTWNMHLQYQQTLGRYNALIAQDN